MPLMLLVLSFVPSIVFAGLAVRGARDRRQRIAPDNLTPEIRQELGLWSRDHPRQGAVRQEDAFLSPQFVNSRQVGMNVVMAVLMLALPVLAIAGTRP